MKNIKYLIISMVFAAFLYSGYAIFQADAYEFSTTKKLTVEKSDAIKTLADLTTWTKWNPPANDDIEYQIDTQAAQPILRWKSKSTSVSGYRKIIGTAANELRFVVVDGSGAEFFETLTFATAKVSDNTDTGQTTVTWLVKGQSDDLVEKLMRPMIVWLLGSQYEQYLAQFETWADNNSSQE